jgi:hypothetical protein
MFDPCEALRSAAPLELTGARTGGQYHGCGADDEDASNDPAHGQKSRISATRMPTALRLDTTLKRKPPKS